MTNNAVMTLRASLNENIFSYLDLLLPDYSTQVKAGDLLYLVNQKIELNNRINSELEAMAKTLYDYWFVQFDFPDANGKPYKSSGGKMVYNEVLKREIPDDWDGFYLDQLCSFKNGINYDADEGGSTKARIINVRNISDSSFFIKSDELDDIWLNSKQISKYLVDSNSILITRSGTPGATRLISEYEENTIYCGFIILCTPTLSALRLPLFFSLKNIEAAMMKKSAGTIMKNVSQDTLKKIAIALPKSLQGGIIDKFNEQICTLSSKISNNQKQVKELEKLRDWLLPMLMNGQVTVA